MSKLSKYHDYVHEVGDRWIVATWSEHHNEWQSSNRRPPPGMETSYVLTYARTLEGLRKYGGIRTYATLKSALAAARRIYAWEVENG